MMIWNLRRIECYDAASVDEHRINFERCPVVGPRVHIHRDGVALVEVDLSAPAHRRVPGLLSIASFRSSSTGLWRKESSADISACPHVARRQSYYWHA